jgi:hypothetical protein
LTQVDEVERVTHYLKRRLKPVATTS